MKYNECFIIVRDNSLMLNNCIELETAAIDNYKNIDYKLMF